MKTMPDSSTTSSMPQRVSLVYLQKFTECVQCIAEESDVRTRAEDLVVRAREHHTPHLRVLEPQAIDHVVGLDVDREVVGVELEVVQTGPHGAVLLMHGQLGNAAVDLQVPMHILVD